MAEHLTPAEIEQRMSEINARPVEELSPEEAVSLAEAEAIDDGTTVSLEAFKDDLAAYSGRIVLRIPRSLHKTLKDAAKTEGVSLNQYMLYKLTR